VDLCGSRQVYVASRFASYWVPSLSDSCWLSNTRLHIGTYDSHRSPSFTAPGIVSFVRQVHGQPTRRDSNQTNRAARIANVSMIQKPCETHWWVSGWTKRKVNPSVHDGLG
jgi:hypothetical protein